MNQMIYTNLWDQRSKSAPTEFCEHRRTGEESATYRLADYPKKDRKG